MATNLNLRLSDPQPLGNRIDPGLTHGFALRPLARSKQRVALYACLSLADVVAITVSIVAATILRDGDAADPLGIRILSLLLPLYLLIAFRSGAYCVPVLRKWTLGARRALKALLLAASGVIAAAFALKISADFSRIAVLLGLAAAAVLIVASRYLSQLLIRRVMGNNVVDEIVLTDGTVPLPARMGRVVDSTALGFWPRLDCPHMLSRLGNAIGQVDRVVIACSADSRIAWAETLRGLGVSVEILMPEIEGLSLLGVDRYAGRITGVVARGPLAIRDRMAKRALDLAALLLLLPGLLIVTLLVAVAIKLDDGGPVFFVQKRIGQGNRIFSMFKFRSMSVSLADSSGSVSASRDDKRVTRVGRILRSTSLDELPQLFNVLIGDMSLVGPRPHALGSTAGKALFWEADSRYFHRHAAKPGLTGLAQVRGFRGATDDIDALTNRVRCDLEYQNGWTLWRDVGILIRTFRVLLHRNAF